MMSKERIDVYTLTTAYDISTCVFESDKNLQEITEREEH